MKRKIKRFVQKAACILFNLMHGIGWFMTYAFLAFWFFGDAMGNESVILFGCAIAGGVSGLLLIMYILRS